MVTTVAELTPPRLAQPKDHAASPYMLYVLLAGCLAVQLFSKAKLALSGSSSGATEGGSSPAATEGGSSSAATGGGSSSAATEGGSRTPPSLPDPWSLCRELVAFRSGLWRGRDPRRQAQARSATIPAIAAYTSSTSLCAACAGRRTHAGAADPVAA